MISYRFLNDYSEGAHPAILELLARTNDGQEDGYGEDRYSQEAAELLREHLASPGAAIHFATGGTQANLVVLAALLRPHESVIAAQTAHIQIHEAGAVEATGHKIHAVASSDGKLTPEQIRGVVEAHTDEHMVKPRAVFLSHATELGTVYRREELERIAATCRELGLWLYLDGARLGPALAATAADVTLPDLARLTDVFYIGATKNGGLFGEAIVINRAELQADFRYHLKQRGALLAKGRFLGLQFLALFRDGLFLELARHANRMAARLADGLAEQGFTFLTPPASNQIFPVLPKPLIASLQPHYAFYVWSQAPDDHAAIRLVTSWATREEKVDEFLARTRLRPKTARPKHGTRGRVWRGQ
ncbi:MAG: aminotransferase class I/II-fold pyridoxal phosphate-dependent enzyme [Akkermansiaceae bacterium]|jgi:threonine aldolase|nr:aminotransferase class I/II-fold pyridoxal phosphate-dependent enzyme [Akkermansiaceae bacterium]